MKLTRDEVIQELEALGGHGRTRERALPEAFDAVFTDSRKQQANGLFVALVGQRTDGHCYLEAAVAAGATALVLQRDHVEGLDLPPVPCLVVEDSLVAYQALARRARSHLPRVVAVTGSVGKTSTREMVVAALGPGFVVEATQANLNNEIGLPQTLLGASESCELMVAELGMDRPGDIALLSSIARPDVAVITNIGHSHLAHLKSREEILRAKTEIVEGMGAEGLLLLNAADPFLARYAREQQAVAGAHFPQMIFYLDHPEEGDPDLLPRYEAGKVRLDTGGCAHFDLYYRDAQGLRRLLTVALSVPGLHHVPNALAALAVAQHYGLPLEVAGPALQHFQVVGARQRRLEIGPVTVIDDSYNAAPESMRAAFRLLQFYAGQTGRRTVALLGGVEELGEASPRIHRAIGRDIAEAGISLALLCGPWAEAMAEGAGEGRGKGTEIHCYPDRDQLAAALGARIREGDIVLLKASHAYEMGALVPTIEKLFLGGTHV